MEVKMEVEMEIEMEVEMKVEIDVPISQPNHMGQSALEYKSGKIDTSISTSISISISTAREKYSMIKVFRHVIRCNGHKLSVDLARSWTIERLKRYWSVDKMFEC